MAFDRLNPAFVEHPVFDTPDGDVLLWRYMDVPRFVALLERRALFFSSIRHFSDRFEGALTPNLLAQLEIQGEDRVKEWRSWNLASYVNCWNEDSHESVALWSMYTSRSGGVAIKSSVSAVLAALQSEVGQVQDEFYIGRVRYVDYKTVAIAADNAFWPLVHKRTHYRFEHEVRLVAWPRRLVGAAQAIRPGGTWPDALREIAPAGYDIGVDPNCLISAVVVAPEAPDWVLELVRAVSLRYGLEAPVERSDLDAEPV